MNPRRYFTFFMLVFSILSVSAAVSGFGSGLHECEDLSADGNGPIDIQSARPRGASENEVLTAEDFARGRVDRGSGLEEMTFTIEINPSLRAYVFRLVPDLSQRSVDGLPHHVGRIEISKAGDSAVVQSMEVDSFAEPSWFIRYFDAQDFNFDGNVDIATLCEFGAKWGSYKHWLFDPSSGQFVTNEVAGELDEIKANDVRLDPASRTIHVQYLILGEGVIGGTYEVSNGHVVLVEVEERRRNSAGTLTIVKRSLNQ